MRSSMLIGLLAASAALCACGQRAPATAASTANGSPGCGAYKDGEGGVIRTFCGGTAGAEVMVDGKSYHLTGGTCEKSMGALALNVGVVSGNPPPSPLPDYVGLSVLNGQEGAFTNAVLAVNVGGEGLAVTTNSGTFTLQGGTFQGTAMGSGKHVSGHFTC